MNSVASVKDRLKNQSIKTGKTMEEMLVAYGLERTIYRLSKSRYADNFTLKGGIFLYALFDGDFARATTDIDLLAQRISNRTEDMRTVFAEIFSMETDDLLRFDLNTLQVIPITEFKDYHGVNVSVLAYLDRTRINISIDIGFSDIVYPARVEMDFPSVLNDESPHIFVYSLSSCVAEKLEAIVSLGYENSRFKDFYDIYVLIHRYDFDGRELAEAIRETFTHRNTPLDDIAAFEPGFTDDPVRQTRWKAFVRKKRAMLPVTLEETIQFIKAFTEPILRDIRSNETYAKYWSKAEQRWIEN
jgi:predicted nucleotidyltransferase component of viral defense system